MKLQAYSPNHMRLDRRMEELSVVAQHWRMWVTVRRYDGLASAWFPAVREIGNRLGSVPQPQFNRLFVLRRVDVETHL